MSKYIITIDGGTTNTRVTLWNDKNDVVACSLESVGARDVALHNNNACLKEAVSNCIDIVMKDAEINWEEIEQIVASGMITSASGLVEIPHLVAPVGIEELAKGIEKVMLPDVCPIPIHFIPGVRNSNTIKDMDAIESLDMMRGEETEVIGIIETTKLTDSCIVIIPGSHTKIISVNAKGQIQGSLTSLTGELLAAVREHTILSAAVKNEYVTEENYDKEMLIKGYQMAQKVGIGRACFTVRSLQTLMNMGEAQLANYLLGIILQNDVAALAGSTTLEINKDTKVIIYGKEILCQALEDILMEDKKFEQIQRIKSSSKKTLAAVGAKTIIKYAQGQND